jgi:TetR/AcrR family transcriptional regulator
MGKKSELTKEKIINSARELFIEKGYAGLKMQELADRANVNKGLLHHYYDNKETLFKTIFMDAFSELIGVLTNILSSEENIELKFDHIVDGYFDLLQANPRLPVFVFSELHRNPDYMLTIVNPQILLQRMEQGGFSNGEVDKDTLVQVFITIASLCVFPFIAAPLINTVLSDGKTFEQFIEERRPLVKAAIRNLLQTL